VTSRAADLTNYRTIAGQAGQKRALVIGAGPGGLCAALALRGVGYEPLVFERWRHGEAGSGLTLWPNAFLALKYLGVAEEVSRASLGTEAIAMRTWDGKTLFRLACEDETANAEIQGAALLRSELIEVLVRRLGEDSIRYGRSCVGYREDQDRVTALFNDGSEKDGDLLVACDGIRSELRRKIGGPVNLRYAGYTVWRGVADFCVSRVGLTSIGRGAQFGLFPMTRGRTYWFASANAREGGANAQPRKRELIDRFRLWHEPIADVIEATEESRIVCTDIYDHQPFKRWSAGRLTLLGDAAHPSTPTMGQGACQAIEDAVVLAECMKEFPDVPRALKLYESLRSKRTGSITVQSRRFGQMGCLTNRLVCWLRDQLIKNIPGSLRVRELRKLFEFDPTNLIARSPSANPLHHRSAHI
jgi:2-polyprenyl-6-methoxyphenol hydroxylase-like FAD-dependent oxidoreductase